MYIAHDNLVHISDHVILLASNDIYRTVELTVYLHIQALDSANFFSASNLFASRAS